MPNLRASLLGIPPELRHQIYTLCFDKWVPQGPHYHRAIASACHQTRSEAFPMLLKECQCFTLEKFITWTAMGKPHLLQEITNMVLLDCTISGLQDAAKESCASPTGYDDVSAVIQEAFSSIPNLRVARFDLYSDLRCPTRGQTDFQEEFLRIIARCCLDISHLKLVSDLLHVTALQGFRNIHSLEWSGLSLSTPQETLAVLRSLPCLDTMKLVRWPESYHRGSHFSVPTTELHAYVSFTSYVLQNLRPLRKFEIWHEISQDPSEFLTTEMLKALLVHRESLVRLSLMTIYPVEGAILDQLLNLIPLLTLECLQVLFQTIPWQYYGIRIAEYVAPSVRFCHISMEIWDLEEKVSLEHHLRCGDGCPGGYVDI